MIFCKKNLHDFLSSADFLYFFSKSTFSKNSYRNTIRESNYLDPEHFVWPDLDPNFCKGYLMKQAGINYYVLNLEISSFPAIQDINVICFLICLCTLVAFTALWNSLIIVFA